MANGLPSDATLTPAIEREFLGYAVEQAHPLLRQWCGAALESDLRDTTVASLHTITDEAGAQRVAGIMQALGLPASAYKGRLIAAGGVRLVAHIDFLDPSGDFPFVKLRCASVPPGAIADWGRLAAAISGAFAEFRPRAVSFFHPSHLPLQAPGPRVYMHLLAAPARDMAERPDAPGLGRVELRRSANLDFYPRYEAAYAEMLDERPYLRGEVGVESRERLTECLEQGLLSEIFVDGAWAGTVAARPDVLAGVRGLHVAEIVLTRAARGQGLGPAVHQRFARSIVETESAAVVMGTISAKNRPSLRAALKAGRVEIGAFHWMDLPG